VTGLYIQCVHLSWASAKFWGWVWYEKI